MTWALTKRRAQGGVADDFFVVQRIREPKSKSVMSESLPVISKAREVNSSLKQRYIGFGFFVADGMSGDQQAF
jgi:hypothetical protein